MIDLHSHILPGVDDGAASFEAAAEMARIYVDQGVGIVACTPHILPGLYHNEGPHIRAAVAALQRHLDATGIPLLLTTGADVHIAPHLADGLRSGRILSLADSRYVLIEPPHHVPPVRLEETLFELMLAGYVPVITHPERLGWIAQHHATFVRLAGQGVWMQITAGSLTGTFGRTAQYWAERLIAEGLAHIVATDSHGATRRPPDLHRGMEAAARLVGEEEARRLVVARPRAIIENVAPADVPGPTATSLRGGIEPAAMLSTGVEYGEGGASGRSFVHRLGGSLRRLIS